MTDNAGKKLTLSGKSTLTLKNVSKPTSAEGKRVVQVEVRKKRVINASAGTASTATKIDEATAAKLKLIAEAKEYEAKREQEEKEKALVREKKI